MVQKEFQRLLFVSFIMGMAFLRASVGLASVMTSQGSMEGVSAPYNTEAFLGVPYAAPPVGDLRWRAPQPYSWQGTLQANKVGNICPQLGNMFAYVDVEEFGLPVGNEDCLFLNLWQPKQSPQKLRPVVFWIHGGSNSKGTAIDPNYDGAYMASHDDVVFISANYRLGVFGAFVHPGLETGDRLDDSGNYLTLDLIAVLKWIHDNAETFGGDPNNVTIAGQSAGCMNVWGLLQSPLAKDLFHKAICSAGLPNAYPSKLVEYRSNDILKELLQNDKVLDIGEDIDKFLKRQDGSFVKWYLRSRTPAQFLAIKRFIIPTQHIQDGYVIPWAGLADLTIGHYNRVPLIMGNTDDEGTYLVGAELFKITDKQLYTMINTPGIQFNKADIIKDDYVSKFDTLTRAGSETINGTSLTLAKGLSAYQEKLYRYKFQWRETPEPWRDLFGAIHGMDAIFYLGNFVTDKPSFARFAWSPENQESRERLRDQMGRYFKGFFHTGDPNTYRLPDDPVWENKSGTMIFQ